MSEQGDPNTTWTATIGVVGAILVFVITVSLQALFYRVENSEIQQKVYSQIPEELSALRADQLGKLNSYRWVDKDNGIAAIPIGEAMKKIAAENRGAPPGAEATQ